jgi:SSS family solute:Na+ symporter
MNVQLIILAFYSAGIITLGLFVSRRVRGASDFLVAGRSLGPGLMFTTFLAANLGAGTTVGAASIGFELGMSAWWWVGSAGIGSLILANLVGPKIWRLAKKYDFQTMGDYLDHRYSRAVRGTIAGLLWVGTLAILAGQLIAIATILEIVAGLPRWQSALAGGLIVMAYFSAGGLWAAARVNAVQLPIMIAGFVLAVPYALEASGGWTVVRETLAASREPGYLSMTGLGFSGALRYLVILVPSFIVSPGLIQKLYGGRDERAVRVGINLNAICLLVFAFVPAVLGMIAYANFPDLANPDHAMGTVLVELLPGSVGLLALAAILSAEISTCDAILLMLSSSLGIDLYKNFIHPEASEKQLLTVSRIAAVAGASLAILLAVRLPSIISALEIFYGLMAVALFVPTVAGLYSRVPGAQSALWTVAGSVLTTIIVFVATDGAGIGILTPYAIGILSALLLMLCRAWLRDLPALRRST